LRGRARDRDREGFVKASEAERDEGGEARTVPHACNLVGSLDSPVVGFPCRSSLLGSGDDGTFDGVLVDRGGR